MATSEARAPASEPRLLQALSDADLIVLVSRGDLDAFAVLYDRHVGAVWRVALHYADDLAAAQEAVAAAFLRLWREPETTDQASLAARLRAGAAREARALRPPAEGGSTRPAALPDRSIMAAVNGVIDDLHRSLGIEESEFFCECGHSRCRERVRLSRSEYLSAREESRSLILQGHAHRRSDAAGEAPPGFSERVNPVRLLRRVSDSG